MNHGRMISTARRMKNTIGSLMDEAETNLARNNLKACLISFEWCLDSSNTVEEFYEGLELSMSNLNGCLIQTLKGEINE